MMVGVERAEGVFFYTPEGKRYFDLISGVSVSNVGHANPAVVEAVQRQAADYMHVMVYGEMIERPQVRYAELLTGMMPGGFDSVYFVNSGAEAVETAIKLGRRATGRSEILSMRRAYHGSTMGAMSMMDDPQYGDAFGPLVGDVGHMEFNNFEDLDRITTRTACVLTEIVQGEGGVRLPREGYLEKLRARCTEVGALLIADEIQTGMGRSGELFAFMKYGVMPDIVCTAKAFGGGMPLGGVVSSKELLDKFTCNPVLGHITTFGGHPVCCAAGLAALEYITANGLAQRAETVGALYERELSPHAAVVEVRRSGLLLAVELGVSERMFRMMEYFAQNGILSDWFLFCDTAFRISPPLTITDAETLESCGIIRRGLDMLI